MRSGVLVSVHAFASDPSRGLFILAFLVVVVGGALSLYAWRAPMLKSDGAFEWASREALILVIIILRQFLDRLREQFAQRHRVARQERA